MSEQVALARRVRAAAVVSRRAVRRRVSLPWRRRLAVAVGGAVGTGLRAAATGVMPSDVTVVPWSVLVVNVVGSLLLGYALTRFQAAAARSTLTVPLLCTGVLGSYTTFSTFAVEVAQLVEVGMVAQAAGYAAGSVVLGVIAAVVGIRAAEARA